MVKWLEYSLAKKFISHTEKLISSLQIWDAHAHIGIDKDGHSQSAWSLIDKMDEAGIKKSVIFPLNEPNDPEFVKANDRILAACETTPDRFIPFFRIDPKRLAWRNEFDKRIKQEFRGIKVHPLSQNFALSNASFYDVCKKAEDAGIVMLIHLGFGVENIAERMYKVVTRFPKLKIVLGHSGFADLNRMIKDISIYENVLFETSTLRVFDIFELLQRVSYKKIVFGSDIPYYDIDVSLLSLLDTALLVEKKQKQLEAMFGQNIRRWLK